MANRFALGATGSPIRDKSYGFALRVVRLARDLRGQREYDLASQILRCGTSVGANVEEAQAGSSRADFVAKIAIAAREARESHYWLRLMLDSETRSNPDVREMIGEIREIILLLTSIVKTSRETPSPSRYPTQN